MEFDIQPMKVAKERILARLLHFSPHSIIPMCITALRTYEEEHDPVKRLEFMKKYRPWDSFLLIKWTLLHGDWQNTSGGQLTEAEFAGFMNLFWELDGKNRLPTHYDHFFLFFRNKGFQQFWIQESGTPTHFARQMVLFSDLQDTHSFKRDFLSTAGVSIDHFLELASVLMCPFLGTTKAALPRTWFSNLQGKYPLGSIENFLAFVASEPKELQRFLRTVDRQVADVGYEYYEQTPLRRYPLIKIGQDYYLYSVLLLMHSMHSLIYDTLREPDPGLFMDKFGPVFENYVAKGVAYAGVPHIREKDLKAELGQGKVVDFLITEDDCNIMIDAKGVEMSQLGLVGHRPDVILDKTRSSALKGIEQALEVASKTQKRCQVSGLTLGSRNFLLVVTYKDLFFGNGLVFYETVAQRKLVLK